MQAVKFMMNTGLLETSTAGNGLPDRQTVRHMTLK
jgi:hypothetical protein